MSDTAKEILDRVSAWPQQDIDERAEIARAIEARRTGVCDVTPEEEAGIREGLGELERGEWTSEEKMRTRDRRPGIHP